MIRIIVVGLAALVGVVVGAVGHAYFAQTASATQAEIASWAEDIRNVLATDAGTVKAKAAALLAKLEAKL